ncbi:MAG: hypothetical protein J6Y36_06970 [Treponema sp.]|nr:hypothetical protein [Treponema sp.]
MEKIVRFSFLFVAFLLFSCENFVSDIVLRTYNDPLDVAPYVDSYRVENKIFISWDEDPGCDEYILERSVDYSSLISNPVFVEVYRGKNLEYVDSAGLSTGTRYLYRLNKKRGGKSFTSKKVGYGVCSAKRRDIYDNHDETTAMNLEYEYDTMTVATANYYDGNTERETDWYYLEIPPRRICEIVITETKDNGTATNASRLNYLILGDQEKTYTDSHIKITNELFEKKIVKFQISASYDPVGNIVVTYNIKLNTTSAINEGA